MDFLENAVFAYVYWAFFISFLKKTDFYTCRKTGLKIVHILQKYWTNLRGREGVQKFDL